MSILKVPVTSDDHIEGSPDAPITLVEYGDYQCPTCKLAYFVVKQLQKHFEHQLRFVFRNFPLSEYHTYAEPAAETAEFAADKGKFWQIHDLIYESQEPLTTPFLFELVKGFGLSTDSLKSVLEQKTYDSKIHGDFLGGVHSGVNGTPTFFINDKRYHGPFDFESLEEAISLLLNK